MKRGYLLIEIMIALAIVATFSVIIASMHATIINWHKQATQYIVATNIALSSLALLQSNQHKKVTAPGFNTTVSSYRPDPLIPFSLEKVTVTFKNPYGREKKVTIMGGKVHARL